jgi:hypothetical protein
MLKAAVVILIIGHVFAGIYSLTAIIIPGVMLKSTFEAVTGKTLDSVQDAGYLKVTLNRYRTAGLYALTTTIFGFFVLFVGFRRAQKWAWWTLLVGGGIALLWGLVNYIVVGSKLHILLQAVVMAIFLVGILIPIKAFFGKAAGAQEADTEASEEATEEA